MDARRGRDAAALALFTALQAISSVYYGVMTAIATAVSVLVLAVSTGQWRSRRRWSLMGMAAVLGALLIAPVAVPYWRTQQREGFGRNLFEAAAHAGSLQSYTQVPPDNLLYGRTGLLLPRAPEPGERDRRHVEHQMFPGLVLIGLAIVGAWRGWRSDVRPVVASAATLVISGVVLSLGPEGLRSVYAGVADLVFGFQAIRAPARFAVVGAEPPAPGPAPFASGETATYEAQWLSGPLEVSAGTIVLSVRTPTSADRAAAEGAVWTFEATAKTAPWVSRFFEANDRFRTLADDQMKPLVHWRALREGRRVLDRVFVYDAVDHRVRAGETIDAARGPSAVVLPLATGARDAVTALWYLRSMTLAPGLSMDVPINDVGRGMTLHLTVGDRETLATPLGSVVAFRVSPRLVERVQRRAPVEATLWFSADERRVPLAVEVTAQFGRVRLELVDYRP